MVADVRALAEEIGPRGTGTVGEKAAAEYVAGRLTAMGLQVQRQTFYAVTSQNAFPLAIDGLALLAVVFYLGRRVLGWEPGGWIAACLALATAPLLFQTIRSASNVLRPFLPKVKSQNVVAVVPPHAERRQHAVVVAHLDTNRCRLAWQSGMVRWLEPLTYATLAMLGLLGLLYLAGALLDDPPWVWWVSLLPASYVVGTVITLWRDETTPFSPGAHDNAAGVAVALEIGRRLVAKPLQHTEVWLALTGAEETDHSGIHALLAGSMLPANGARAQADGLREPRSLLRQSAFVVLEGVGSGELVYLRRQGLCTRFGPDPRLLAVAEQVAEENPEFRGTVSAQMKMEDDTSTLRRSGYRAICIAGRDPETGALPHWHRPGDTADTVSSDFLERAAGFVEAILVKLDLA